MRDGASPAIKFTTRDMTIIPTAITIDIEVTSTTSITTVYITSTGAITLCPLSRVCPIQTAPRYVKITITIPIDISIYVLIVIPVSTRVHPHTSASLLIFAIVFTDIPTTSIAPTTAIAVIVWVEKHAGYSLHTHLSIGPHSPAPAPHPLSLAVCLSVHMSILVSICISTRTSLSVSVSFSVSIPVVLASSQPAVDGVYHHQLSPPPALVIAECKLHLLSGGVKYRGQNAWVYAGQDKGDVADAGREEEDAERQRVVDLPVDTINHRPLPPGQRMQRPSTPQPARMQPIGQKLLDDPKLPYRLPLHLAEIELGGGREDRIVGVTQVQVSFKGRPGIVWTPKGIDNRIDLVGAHASMLVCSKGPPFARRVITGRTFRRKWLLQLGRRGLRGGVERGEQERLSHR